jgi:hypothetical protein
MNDHSIDGWDPSVLVLVDGDDCEGQDLEWAAPFEWWYEDANPPAPYVEVVWDYDDDNMPDLVPVYETVFRRR